MLVRLCITLAALALVCPPAEARTYRTKTTIIHKHVHSYAVAPVTSYAVPVQAVPQAVIAPAPAAAPSSAPAAEPAPTTYVSPPVTYYSAPVTTYRAAPVRIVRPLTGGERRRLNRNGAIVVSP